jgi:hypothetical protein
MTRLCFLLVGLLGVTGCGAADAAGDAVDAVEETRTMSLHGTWRSESGVVRPASITVEQRALSAKLTVILDGHVCLAESTVEAKLTLNGVETTADVAGMHLEMEGSPGLDEIIGNFAAIKDGPCPGQGGWVSVFR